MKAKLAALLLLLLPLALAAGTSMSLNALAARTSLVAEASSNSTQVYGASTLFTCRYADTRGNAVLNSTCYLVVDGRRGKAVAGGVDHVYGELLTVGQHSWYCSCSAIGYQEQESDPRSLSILPQQNTESLKLEASSAIEQAERAVADAKQAGADTGKAEGQLEQAKAALQKGDYRLADALASNSLVSNAFNSRDRITDLALLLVPTMFFGVLVVVVLFLLLRK